MSKITAKVKNPSDQAAYLASFPNGAMTKRTLGDVSWTIRQGPSTKRASKRAKPTFLAGGSGKVNWNSPEDLCRRAGQNKYYVAVYNKKKGELEEVEGKMQEDMHAVAATRDEADNVRKITRMSPLSLL